MDNFSTPQLIRAKRLQRNLSARSLALACGVSHGYVAKYEAGQIDQISLRAFSRMAKALRLTPAEIGVIISMEAAQ